MRFLATVTLLTGCAVAACTSSVLPVSTSPTAPAATEQGTYQVSFDIHYGYVFDRGGDRFFPEIADAQLPKFDHFFSNANLSSLVGKRLYCDCEIAIAGDGSRRRVEKATLYAR